MQKIWLSLLLAACLLIAVVKADDEVDDENENENMSLDDLVNALESFAEGCEPTPEREHIEELARNTEEPQYETKCFRHCLFKRFQLIEDGQTTLDKEKAVEMMSMMWQDREDDLGQVIEVCNTENAGITEKCENAHRIGMCNLRELRERGFNIPEFKE